MNLPGNPWTIAIFGTSGEPVIVWVMEKKVSACKVSRLLISIWATFREKKVLVYIGTVQFDSYYFLRTFVNSKADECGLKMMFRIGEMAKAPCARNKAMAVLSEAILLTEQMIFNCVGA